jgi:SnoaL-like domain
MDKDRIAQNLAAVENHSHSEALNEVETALETFTDDIVWEAPAPNGLHRSFSGKEAVAKNYRELFASMRDVQFQFLFEMRDGKIAREIVFDMGRPV